MRFKVRRAESKRYLTFIILLVLSTSATTLFAVRESSTSRSSIGPSTLRVRSPLAPPVSQSLPYDEQVGITFAQNFTSLAFNVTAVAQRDSTTGIGPAYLLNGLTDSGYWYQVGLSYNWPDQNGAPMLGFNMSYEVFEPCTFYCNNCQGSIFPVNCGIGTANLVVNPGDIVQLSLSLSGGSVGMRTKDWNTNSTNAVSFTAEGGTQFVGLQNLVSDHGFFTGLMTEQYYKTPYNGTGQPVLYRQTGYNVSAGLMWMDEFDTYNFQPVFSDQTQSSLSFANGTLLQYFSSHGTAEAANGNEFVTGLTPITSPSLTSSISSAYRPGQQASIVVGIEGTSMLTVRITSLKVSSEFGIFDVTSSAPSNVGTNSTFNTQITIPSSLSNGTYSLTIVASIQFQDPQITGWFAAQPIYSTSVLTVSGPPIPPPKNAITVSELLVTLGGIFLPIIVSVIASGTVAAVVLSIVFTRREQPIVIGSVLNPQTCSACGILITENASFCTNCGIPLSQPSNPVGSEAQTGPSGPSPS